MDDRNPAKPEPNSEKFKPQNVAEDDKREAQRPTDQRGRDLARGSEPETRSASNVRR